MSLRAELLAGSFGRGRRVGLRAAVLAAAAGLVGVLAPSTHAQALVSNAFTYQGELSDGGLPASGVYDLQFRLFNTLGTQVGPTLTVSDQNVTNGRFAVALDFGDQYNGEARLLEVSVRPGASVGAYTALTPRQTLSATPYAHALQVPVSQTALVNSTMINLTNESTSNAAPVMRLTSGAPSGNAAGISFQPVLITDTNDGNGIASYVSASGAFGMYVRHEGALGVGVYVDQVGSSGRAAFFRSLTDTNSSAAVEITQAGTGTGLTINTSNATNTANALSSVQNGTGSAGFFDNNNTAATRPTLDVESSAAGESIPGGSQDNGIAIKGASTGAFGIGVMGRGVTAGVFGYSATTGGAGVLGRTDGGGGSVSSGVRGEGNGAGTVAVAAFNNFGTGLYALAQSGTALFADNGGSNVTGFAGDFNGRVRITGNLQVTGSVSKGSGSFKIDHPLDPENRFLYHSFVESPDMKNIYDGVVTLDDNGEAVVSLPEYFETLNKDFRYQLTCIGGHAPVYVSREVASNSFAIAGGRPGLKVSWTITGIRKDPYANAYRIQNEVEKSSDERGMYLYPEVYGKPESLRIGTPRSGQAPAGPGAN